MRADIDRWKQTYPRTTRFIETLYREQRIAPMANDDTARLEAIGGK